MQLASDLTLRFHRSCDVNIVATRWRGNNNRILPFWNVLSKYKVTNQRSSTSFDPRTTCNTTSPCWYGRTSFVQKIQTQPHTYELLSEPLLPNTRITDVFCSYVYIYILHFTKSCVWLRRSTNEHTLWRKQSVNREFFSHLISAAFIYLYSHIYIYIHIQIYRTTYRRVNRYVPFP